MFALSVRWSALLLGVTAAPLLSQTIISGVVRTERGGPLASAAVQVKGTHGGAMTSETGRYRLVIPNDGFATVDSLTVTARAIGFEPLSQRVAARPGSVTLDFVLEATTIRLEGVVVTGTAAVSDAASSRGAKDGAKSMAARLESSASDSRDAPRAKAPALAKARADGTRVSCHASAGKS